MQGGTSGESGEAAEAAISLELRTDDSAGGKLAATLKGILNVATGDTTVVGPRTDVVLLDRRTGRPIHVQDYGYDYQGALNAKSTFEEDLRTPSVDAFCQKYFIEWRPEKPEREDTK